MKRNKQRNSGFTLIELLVAILIIGVLAAIALPQYYYMTNLAKTKTQMSIIRTIADADERYYLVNGKYIDHNIGLLDVTVPNYPNIDYWLADDYVTIRNTNNDIRISYALINTEKIPQKHFFCYYYYTQWPGTSLSVEAKEKICRKICGSEIQNNFPMSYHKGCIIKP